MSMKKTTEYLIKLINDETARKNIPDSLISYPLGIAASPPYALKATRGVIPWIEADAGLSDSENRWWWSRAKNDKN